jgi:hypothetical protein
MSLRRIEFRRHWAGLVAALVMSAPSCLTGLGDTAQHPQREHRPV